MVCFHILMFICCFIQYQVCPNYDYGESTIDVEDVDPSTGSCLPSTDSLLQTEGRIYNVSAGTEEEVTIDDFFDTLMQIMVYE